MSFTLMNFTMGSGLSRTSSRYWRFRSTRARISLRLAGGSSVPVSGLTRRTNWYLIASLRGFCRGFFFSSSSSGEEEEDDFGARLTGVGVLGEGVEVLAVGCVPTCGGASRAA